MRSNHPNPKIWPMCERCHEAWILRRCLSMSKGWVWLWQADCEHRKTAPVLANKDGLYELEVEGEPGL